MEPGRHGDGGGLWIDVSPSKRFLSLSQREGRSSERGLAGAATVLSFAVVADYFPREFAARANGALNLLHFGWAFTIQYGIGLVVGQWPSQDGHYPVVAYQAAFGLCVALQAAALVWFAVPWIRTLSRNVFGEPSGSLTGSGGSYIDGPILEAGAGGDW